jgi:hypothetical protein
MIGKDWIGLINGLMYRIGYDRKELDRINKWING